MKPNLVPTMSKVDLFDKDGQPVVLQVKLLQYQGRYAVFMADGPGPSVLARGAGALIAQLAGRLELPVAQTSFYRHIYLPHQGSVFGCFQVGWLPEGLVSHYTFSMMAPLIDDLNVRRILKEGTPVQLSYAKLRNLASVG